VEGLFRHRLQDFDVDALRLDRVEANDRLSLAALEDDVDDVSRDSSSSCWNSRGAVGISFAGQVLDRQRLDRGRRELQPIILVARVIACAIRLIGSCHGLSGP
jgi:hypothetical protein